MPDPSAPASHRAFAWFVIGPGLAVVGSCAACIGVVVIPNLRAAQHDRAEMDLLSIRNALQLYRDHHHAYPPISGRLDVLVSERILDALPADPFGHPYVYDWVDGGPQLVGFGADGAPGGVDEDADLRLDVENGRFER